MTRVTVPGTPWENSWNPHEFRERGLKAVVAVVDGDTGEMLRPASTPGKETRGALSRGGGAGGGCQIAFNCRMSPSPPYEKWGHFIHHRRGLAAEHYYAR